MDVDLSDLPDDLATLKTVVIAAVEKTKAVAAELANEQARRADDAALIAHMKLPIEKLNVINTSRVRSEVPNCS